MIKEALNALGYYQPTIKFSHSEDDSGLIVSVERAEHISVYTSDIVLKRRSKR